jgi:hypothetical protein
MKTVDKALNDLILHFEHHFRRTVEGLTIKQLSFLRARVEVGYKLCSEAILKTYQLGSSSNVARIKQSLKNMEIIDTGNHDTGNHDTGKHDTVFIDPVFREWLKIHYFKIDSVPHCRLND